MPYAVKELMMPGSGGRFQPVVALDLDGVIRQVWPEPGESDAIQVPVTVDREHYPEVFHGHPEWDEDGLSTEVEFFSRVGVEWVHGLLELGVDVQWATTWQEYANTYFAKPLGLPDLPVAVTGDGKGFRTAGIWKAAGLARQFDGRPLLWVDDQPANGAEVLDWRRRPIDRALTHVHRVPDPARGLQERDITAITSWLTLVATPEGQQQLRRERRVRLDQEREERILRERGSIDVYRTRNRLIRALRHLFPESYDADRLVGGYLARGRERILPNIRELLHDWGHHGTPTAEQVLQILDGLDVTPATERNRDA